MKIVATVSNDLTFDQRMHRICTALAEAGHEVELVGRRLAESKPLDSQAFKQTRLPCFTRRGPLFYLEWNLRLFAFLLLKKYDALNTVDLDTMPGGGLAALLRGKRRVFDAHEFFTETPEVTGRFFVKNMWRLVGWLFVRFYHQAYTVGTGLAGIFGEIYGRRFGVVRNVPSLQSLDFQKIRTKSESPILLYQGALNAGRGIEQMIAAMTILEQLKTQNPKLETLEFWLAGEGDLSLYLRQLAAAPSTQANIKFLGQLKPAELRAVTAEAWLGLNLLENKGLSYYYSLANKFFDYAHAAVPGLTVDFPEYRALNAEHEVAVLLPNILPETIAAAVQNLLENPAEHARLRAACLPARAAWNWEREKQALLDCWQEVFKAGKKR